MSAILNSDPDAMAKRSRGYPVFRARDQQKLNLDTGTPSPL